MDKEIRFTGAIRVGVNTNVLENFFHASLYDISAEDGSLGHLQEVFGGDNVLALGLLISYSSGVVTSIMAIDDFVDEGSVPLVPRSEIINSFIETKIAEIKFQPFYQASTYTSKMDDTDNTNRTGINTISPAKAANINASSQTIITNGALRIVLVAFVIGIGIILVLLSIWMKIKLIYLLISGIYVYAGKLYQKYIRHTDIPQDTSGANTTSGNAEYNFDYPYEDIGKVTGM